MTAWFRKAQQKPDAAQPPADEGLERFALELIRSHEGLTGDWMVTTRFVETQGRGGIPDPVWTVNGQGWGLVDATDAKGRKHRCFWDVKQRMHELLHREPW